MSNPERPVQPGPTSPRSDRVRRVAGLAGRSARRRSGAFRLDGPQAVRSLLAHRPDLAEDVYLTGRTDAAHPELADLAAEQGLRIHVVDEEIIRAMVRDPQARQHAAGADPGDEGPVTPQGVLAVARIPEAPRLGTAVPADGPTTVVVLDTVRDPGNVGTLIRTADAAGAAAVVLTTGCADPYAPKAVRASVGSILHLPVLTGADAVVVLDELRALDLQLIATSGYAEHDLFDAPLSPRAAWLLGNEAHGLAPETLETADLTVRIPLAGRAESLNVTTAAAVCLFESLRRAPRDAR